MNTPPHLPYRREIDGLRSIAVLSVVLYHFGVPGLRGGFVGVDVFFVISGFLIGGLLWREGQATGTISLKRFYMRRIKRLAPAYVAMAFASLIVGYIVLLPFEFREFGKSLLAATVYLSNVHFFRESGYFETASENKVLLHTWSLSVEEQFYIVLPILMLVLLRWSYGLRALLWFAFAISLVACVWMTQRSQPAAFYLFPFRAWELLAGVLLAIEGQRRKKALPQHASLSLIGLGLVLASIVLIPAGAAFPGWHAIFPVLGTVLIILNGQQNNVINRMLSQPVPVGIGLISYSLYLWHWPVLTLSTYYRGEYAGGLETGFWLLLSFTLAALSWRFVERPVRRSSFGALPTFSVTALVSAMLVAAGGFIYLKDGMIERFGPPLRTHIEASADFLQDWSRCVTPTSGPFKGIRTCPIGPDRPPEVLVWGDSHVRALKEGMELAAYEADVPALIIWRSGCAPVFGLIKGERTSNPVKDRACTASLKQMEQALQEPLFKRVMLVGRWGYYLNGTGIGSNEKSKVTLTVEGTTGSQSAQFIQGLHGTINALNATGTEVFLLKAIPEIADYISPLIARELAGNRLDEAGLQERVVWPRAKHETRLAPLHDTLPDQPAVLLDPTPYFCDETTCSAMHEGKAEYFDNNHLTNSGSKRIRALFAPLFALDQDG